MSAEIITFGYSWPALLAITDFFEKQGYLTAKIYQDEKALLQALHHHPSLPLLFDASPHRKILMIAAIATTARLRTVFFTARTFHLNDKAVADFYFEEKKCLTHARLLSMTKAELHDATRVERSAACLSPGIMLPRIMNLLYDKKALYKEIQENIYHRLYLLGATRNEIDTLKLLIAGLSIRQVAKKKTLQAKTIYSYQSQLAQKMARTVSSRQLVRELSVKEENQDKGYLEHIYNTRCNTGKNRCAGCPLYYFCYGPASEKYYFPGESLPDDESLLSG